MTKQRGRPKEEIVKKVYCEIVEGITYSDRCLWKLSKIIEGNKVCEACLLRETEEIKLGRIEKRKTKPEKRIKFESKKSPRPAREISEDTNRVYSIQFLCKQLGKSERTIQDWAQKGKIPAQKIDGDWHFIKEEIDHWLSEKKHGTDVVMTSSVQPDKDSQGSSRPQEAIKTDGGEV